MYLSPFADELLKLAHLTVLTGGSGAGKSAWAKKNKDKFDLVLGIDTGKTVNGRYISPDRAERTRLRGITEDRALAASAAGKTVLVEGYPKGLLKHPRVMAAADKRMVLGTGKLKRLFRAGKRSVARGSNLREDLTYVLKGFAKEKKDWKKLTEYGPFTKVR